MARTAPIQLWCVAVFDGTNPITLYHFTTMKDANLHYEYRKSLNPLHHVTVQQTIAYSNSEEAKHGYPYQP